MAVVVVVVVEGSVPSAGDIILYVAYHHPPAKYPASFVLIRVELKTLKVAELREQKPGLGDVVKRALWFGSVPLFLQITHVLTPRKYYVCHWEPVVVRRRQFMVDHVFWFFVF